MYSEMIKYVRDFFDKTDTNASELDKKFPFRNRFWHSMRVYEWAKRINSVEGGDEEVVSISAIFHDIGKPINNGRDHALTGSKLCRNYLESIKYDVHKTEKVVQAIACHSSKEDTGISLTLEDKILMDADLLDEVGAIMVLWDALDTGAEENPSYSKVYERLLQHYPSREEDIIFMHTREGKRLYQERINFLKSYIKNLKFELGI